MLFRPIGSMASRAKTLAHPALTQQNGLQLIELLGYKLKKP